MTVGLTHSKRVGRLNEYQPAAAFPQDSRLVSVRWLLPCSDTSDGPDRLSACRGRVWLPWSIRDSNPGPLACEASALTN